MKVKRRLGFADGAGPDSPQTARRHYPARPCPRAWIFETPEAPEPYELEGELGPEAAGFKVLEAGIHEGDPKGGCQ